MKTLRLRLPLALFVTATLLVYLAAVYVVRILAQTPAPGLLAAALTFDLVVLVPVLYYGLLVRRQGWPWITVVPVFLLSLALAYQILPAGHHTALHVLGYLIVPAELLVLGMLGVRAYRTAQHLRALPASNDLLATFQAGLRQTVSAAPVADIVAYELGVLAYALTGWRCPTPDAATQFTYHRRSSYGTVVTAMLVAACVEVIAMHWLLQLWSVAVAWVLTGLSLYGMVWGIAEVHAARLRLIEVSAEALIIRSGLRWTVHVPFSAMDQVWHAKDCPLPRKAPHLLDVTPLGDPDYLIMLNEPVVAHGLYGYRKTITHLQFTVDAPADFERTLMRAFEAWKSSAA